MTTASKPAYFSMGPNLPPACVSPIAPVSGESAVTQNRLTPLTGAPVTTEPAIVRTLPSPRGSVSGEVSFSRK